MIVSRPGAHLRTFAALADPTRARLVSRLAYGPATAGQLAELFQTTRPAVSQHIRALREAGLVRGSREGKFIWYELAGDALVEAEHWLGSLAETWSRAPTRKVHRPAPAPAEETH